MFNRKPQVIKFEQNLCNAKVDDNQILFVRVPGLVTDKKALLEVPYTHDAIMIKGGGDLRYYKSGTYPVFDNKQEVKNWKQGISVDVVYIPKDTRVLIRWGTPNRLTYRDKASNKVITVGANGEFDVSVTNPEQFFRKVVGVKKEFNLAEFTARYRETVATEFADIFLHVVEDKNLTYDQFTINKKQIGEAMGAYLNPKFEAEWGLSVLNFKIANFNLDDDDIDAIEADAAEKRKKDEIEAQEQKERERLKEHLAELERLADKEWEREKYLRQLELQDKSAYYDVLKITGLPGAGAPGSKPKGANFCAKCGHSCETTADFCPNCGNRLGQSTVTCPKCGKANNGDASFCAKCGAALK